MARPKQQRRVFLTPIRGCDIFRKAIPERRFFDVAKKTSQDTSVTLNFALRDRVAPHPASQTVAQKSHRADPRRLHISQSNIVTSLFSTCGACSKTVQKCSRKNTPRFTNAVQRWPQTRTKIDHPDSLPPAAQNVAQKAIQIAPDRPSRSGGTRRSPGKQPVAKRGV